MKSTYSFAWASALSLPVAMAIACPPTGAVLPPPKLCAVGNITASLQQSLRHLASNSSRPAFNVSSTSFSVQITSPDATFFEYHHTAPLINATGVDEVNGDTIYRVASVSKLITAYAVLLQHGINLDDPITRFLPDLSDVPGLETYEEITLRMLMSHIGGGVRDGGSVTDLALTVPPEAAPALGLPLPVFPPDYPTCDRTPGQPCTRDDLVDLVRSASSPWRPGHRAAYSNFAFSMLGFALQNITGLPYHNVITEYLAEPLGLTATGMELASLDNAIIPIGMGSAGITVPLGIYNATLGLYSTPNDLNKILRSILSHTLLSEGTVNAWLKPAAFTGSAYAAVGAPWEIYTPQNLAHTPRPIEIYAKSGGMPGYGAFVAVIPEFNIGISVNAAGDESVVASRFILDLVVQDLVPKLESLARHQAMTKYAGEYVDPEGDDEGSIVIRVDDGPGLRISEWTRNGSSILTTWAAVAAAPLRNSATRNETRVPVARAYPVGEGDRWQVAFDAGTMEGGIFGQACEQWLNTGAFKYAGLQADELVFDVEGGHVTGLRVPGTRQVLIKV